MNTRVASCIIPIASSHKNVPFWIIIPMALFLGLVLCNRLCVLCSLVEQ